MYYLKTSKAKKPKRKVINISTFQGINFKISESILPYKYSPMSYNFMFGNGSLCAGIGFKYSELPLSTGVMNQCSVLGEPPKKMWLYRKFNQVTNEREDNVVVVTVSNKVYSSMLPLDDVFTRIWDITVIGEVNAVNYRYNGEDVLLISSESGGLYMYNGIDEPTYISNAPKIKSMCVHYERLYATTQGEQNEIWFSDDYNPTNWNVSEYEGGFIQFNDNYGRALRVINYIDSVYVFRDYGINRLVAYGDQNEFSMSNLVVTSGKIYAETVAVCGDRVIYLADDGLYVFYGVSTTKILDNITGQITNKNESIASYHHGKYYLATVIDYEDDIKILSENVEGTINNSMLIFDIKAGTVNLTRGIEISCFMPVNVENADELFVGFATGTSGRIYMISECGSVQTVALPKYYRTSVSDLGYSGEKVIRKILINTKYNAKVRLIADDKTYDYFVRGSYKISTLDVNICAENVAVCIMTDEKNAEIRGITLEVDIV